MSKLQTIPSTVSLLEGGSGKPEVFTVIRFPKTDDLMFTQSEISLIRKWMLVINEAYDESKLELTDYKEKLWQGCNPDDSKTEDTFIELNKAKDKLRKLRKEQKQLNSIFTKLKKQNKIA